MTNESLILLDYGKRTAVAEAALLGMQERALAASALISKVDSVDSNTDAVAAQAELHSYIKSVEAAEKAALKPLNEMRTAIFGLRDKMLAEVKPEQLRLAKLVGDFQELELAKQRAAEAAKRLEEQRLEQERLAEERRVREAAEAEQAKLRKAQAEALAKERAAKDEAQRIEAEKVRTEIERQQSLAAATSLAAMADVQEKYDREVRALPPVEAPVRAEGQVVKTQWDITVTDIHALYRSHPLCCDVKPRLTEIKALLDQGIVPKGVTAKKVTVASIRSERGQKLIEV